MIINDNYKKIFGGYLLMVFLGLMGLYGFVKFNKNSYDEAKYFKLTRGIGAWRDKTDDLCKYYIEGDPYVSGGNYVKLRISCRDGRMISNTIDLSAVKVVTVGGIINEYKRIVGYIGEVEDKNKWNCQLDGETIKDFDIVPILGASIDCHEK